MRAARPGGPGGAGCAGPCSGCSSAVLGVGLLGVLAVAVAYVRTPIPDPNDAVTAQTTTIFYADGVTELGSFAAQDRTIVGPDAIPETVRQAVVAAEDRSFYDEPRHQPHRHRAGGLGHRHPASRPAAGRPSRSST